ncbi:hypothetical protein L9W92_06325 [Pelotomaculum terephthalicicum JT]|uniref:hypothetical protein n=1 Tax=Pelotomaculum terephthalicicum TaxID=206393 RepID=UPI001F046E7D|nr:hypothetical protein [Pelotomaculum terephthalicicum]MCG9967667.1 hypothetical protein [Pelotomaculum terephthalicicum JT]
MSVYWQGLVEAIHLLMSGARDVLEVILRILHVSGTATIIGTVIGVPLGTLNSPRFLSGTTLGD